MIKFCEPEKKQFIEAYLRYREDGRSAYAAYKAARMELSSAAKPVPCWRTFQKWLLGKEQPASVEPGGSGRADPPSQDPGEEEAEEQEAAGSGDDYTHRLELMVRLYRTRSEEACDAVCDRLLPELLAGEE